MDHRYGRHGPRAWLRWYSRHHWSTAQPNAFTLIRHEQGRIIITIMQNDPTTASGNTPIAGMPALQPPSNYHRTQQQLFESERNPIISQARIKAQSDNHGNRIPPEDGLRDEIEDAVTAYLQPNDHPHLMDASVDINAFIAYFKGIYLTAYLGYFGVGMEGAEKFFLERSEIPRQAERDKRSDSARSIELSNNEREYQAAIRIAEIFKDRRQKYSIGEIVDLIPVYTRAYGKSDQEERGRW